MRRRLYPYERTRCRRAKLWTDSGYAGGLLLNEPPYWYRIPSTFCDPLTLDARPATFMDIADNIRRAPLAALRDLSAFLSYLIISPTSLLLLLLLRLLLLLLRLCVLQSPSRGVETRSLLASFFVPSNVTFSSKTCWKKGGELCWYIFRTVAESVYV